MKSYRILDSTIRSYNTIVPKYLQFIIRSYQNISNWTKVMILTTFPRGHDIAYSTDQDGCVIGHKSNSNLQPMMTWHVPRRLEAKANAGAFLYNAGGCRGPPCVACALAGARAPWPLARAGLHPPWACIPFLVYTRQVFMRCHIFEINDTTCFKFYKTK